MKKNISSFMEVLFQQMTKNLKNFMKGIQEIKFFSKDSNTKTNIDFFGLKNNVNTLCSHFFYVLLDLLI